MGEKKQRTSLYEWVPGQGPMSDASERLRDAFPLPRRPMGEAWFMGHSREMYLSLLNEPLAGTNSELHDALEALASGPGSFGMLDEWREWLHYLLGRTPDLIGAWDTADLYETLITAFVAQYPSGDETKPYRRFIADALSTLGNTLMSANFWAGGRIKAGTALSSVFPTPNGMMLHSGGCFSAALFFVLKYIDNDFLAGWWKSVISIDDTVWRAKLLLWIASSSLLLLETGAQPESLESEYADGSGWNTSWCLKGAFPSVDADAIVHPFLSQSRQRLFAEELQRTLSADVLLGWHAAFADESKRFGDCTGIIYQLELAFDRSVALYDLRSK